VKILVTGAGGMLGSALIPALIDAGHDPWPTDLRVLDAGQWTLPAHRLTTGQLDVRRPDEIARWVVRIEPDLVMHLAAETDVDLCEAEQDYARDTNTLGTLHVARACETAALPLVYISTAGVFDGQKEDPYNELDPAHPINVYGRSKLDGEEIVQSLLQRYFIVRAGWMVGGGAKDHKFVARVFRQVAAGATTVYAVDDKFGTPTYAPDFACCLTRLMETDHYGLYHMANLGRGSRYDVAQVILEALGRTDSVELVPVGSEFFKDTYPAPRPRSEMMHNLMLERLGWNRLRPWEAAVTEYLLTAFPEVPIAPDAVVTSR
jgi:dTDP-4-dehydrorhamnose reductase